MDDLRRQIAEALGWTVKQGSDGYWYLYRPDGTRASNHITPEDAWEHTPDWPNDVNAALRLVEDEGISSFMLTRIERGAWVASINSPSSRLTEIGQGLDELPARAICHAWQAWQVAREQPR